MSREIRIGDEWVDTSEAVKCGREILGAIYKTLGDKNISINGIDDILDFCKALYKKIPINRLQKKCDDSTDEATAEQLVDGQAGKELAINNNDTAVNKDVPPVIELFNKICISLPKVLMVTDVRKKMIGNVIEQFNPDFKSVFEKIEKSDFLTGRNGKWTNCGFDWIFTPSNFVKIINGYYDNPPKSAVKIDGR